MGKSNAAHNSEDLWLDFLKDAPEQDDPATDDGSEWSVRNDRRTSPLANIDFDGNSANE